MKIDENTKFEEAARAWLAIKKLEVKENTFEESYRRTVEKILSPRLDGLALGDITRDTQTELFSYLAETYCDSTLRKCAIVLNAIFAEAVYQGANLKALPPIKVKSKKPPITKRTYTVEQVEELEKYCKVHKYGLSVYLMLELGLRCSEMLGLKWEDIDFENNIVHIQRACVSVKGRAALGATKTGTSNRQLPISTACKNYLYEMFLIRNESCFVVNVGKTLMTPANYTKNRYNIFFRDAFKECGIIRRSPHELRHTCGTLLYNKTGDLYAVSKYMGHSSMEITARYYVHSDVEVLRKHLGIE